MSTKATTCTENLFADLPEAADAEPPSNELIVLDITVEEVIIEVTLSELLVEVALSKLVIIVALSGNFLRRRGGCTSRRAAHSTTTATAAEAAPPTTWTATVAEGAPPTTWTAITWATVFAAKSTLLELILEVPFIEVGEVTVKKLSLLELTFFELGVLEATLEMFRIFEFDFAGCQFVNELTGSESVGGIDLLIKKWPC
ncbi:hypothetical protein DFP72DRAFT_905795 [Ephemerocybe angulata]|uniref:Uncharacterized protein n=1 Tax=Ephemerocybe angulata TaxID=980116 RepID=A0A8H6HRT7_9AGAR|nr:hypothetical protein DFP72DRAFT_905795 [Tulosesus angulatus]